MDEKQFSTLIIIIVVLALVQMGATWTTVNTNLQPIAKDTNTLLVNDQIMANYIQANSQTMDYLNKNCKQTADNNTTITLTCFKVNQQ